MMGTLTGGNVAQLVFLACGAVVYVIGMVSERASPAHDPAASSGLAGADTSPQRENGVAAPNDLADGGRARAPSPGADPMLCLDRYDLDGDAATRLKLPSVLREISGLAATSDGRLLAHGDERAVICEVDAGSGEVVKSFRLADERGTIEDDFEGIAVAHGRIYMVTGTGRIYEFEEGEDGATVRPTVHETRLQDVAEIEGLAFEPLDRTLLLACKNPLGGERRDRVTLFRWSIDARSLTGEPVILPLSEFERRLSGAEFQPSGIERDAVTGHYVLVAARQARVAEVTSDGRVLTVRKLPKKPHPQAEGLTFAPDGTLIIADEAADKHGTLTLFPVRNDTRSDIAQ